MRRARVSSRSAPHRRLRFRGPGAAGEEGDAPAADPRFLWELDDSLFQLTRDGEPVAVRRQVLDLLRLLVENRHRVVTKEEIVAHLWPDAAVSDSSLATAVGEARAALGDHGRLQAMIRTVHGRGYRFVPEVEERLEEPPPAATGPAPAPAGALPLRYDALARLFVGRAALLGRLDDALGRALADEGPVVFLTGERGIGKTRTAEELARRAEQRGLRVLVGRCEGESGAPPFWPWWQVIRALGETCSDAQLRDAMGPGAPELAEWVPELAERLPDLRPSPRLEAGQARFRLFDSVDRFFRRCAERRPLLLVLEDLHSADDSSWMLLRFLVRSAGPRRIGLLATWREGEPWREDARAGVLSELLAEPRVGVERLEGLSPEEVADYLEKATGAPAPPEVAEALHRRTGGNPFFLHQLVLYVASAEGLEALLREGPGELRLPTDLREALARQLGALSEESQRALTAAAVMGVEFSLAPLQAVLAWSRERVLASLEEADAAGVVQPQPRRLGRYRFAHRLVRDALVERLSELGRARLHARVAEALERLHAGEPEEVLTELSHHAFEAARLGGEERALELAERAMRFAAARMAHEEAARHGGRALQLLDLLDPPDDVRRFEVLAALGTAHTRAGWRDEAREAVRRATALARRLGDAERAARAALVLEPGFLAIETGVVDAERIALLDEALEAPLRPELRLRLLASLGEALHWTGETARKRALAGEAGRLGAGLAHADDAALHQEVARFWTLWDPAHTPERVHVCARVIELASRQREDETVLLFRLFRICCLLELGRPTELDREVRRFGALADELRQPQSSWYTRMLQCMRALLEGRFDAVEPLAREYLSLGQRVGDRNAVQSFGGQLTLLRIEQGRVEEVAAMFRGLSVEFEHVELWQCARIYVDAVSGRPDAARAGLAARAQAGLETIRRDSNWLAACCLLADAAAELGEPAPAAWLEDALAPFRDRFAVAGFAVIVWGSVARRLARLAALRGALDEAAEGFAEAAERERELGALPWVAHTLGDHARLEAARGRTARARELAGEARSLAERLDMPWLAERLDALAAA